MRCPPGNSHIFFYKNQTECNLVRVHRPGAQVVEMGEAWEAFALCAQMFDHFSCLLVPQVGKARQAANQLGHIPVLEATVEDEKLGEVWAAAGR